jgi:hypothetical protein
MSLESWQVSFLLTVLVEVPVVVVALGGTPTSIRSRAAVAVAAQLLTHPVVWFVFPRIGALSHGQALWASEVWAGLLEAVLFTRLLPGVPFAQAVGTSALANGLSLGLGILLREWGGPAL